MAGQRALDVPPEPLHVDELALRPGRRLHRVGVLRQQAGRLFPQRADADALDLQQRIVVGALIDVAVGVGGDAVLLGPDGHLLVAEGLRRARRAHLGRGVVPDVLAVDAKPLPSELAHGVDPALPLPADFRALFPDGLQPEAGRLPVGRRSPGDAVVALPGAPPGVRHLGDMEDALVPVGVRVRGEQVALDVPDDSRVVFFGVCEPFQAPSRLPCGPPSNRHSAAPRTGTEDDSAPVLTCRPTHRISRH